MKYIPPKFDKLADMAMIDVARLTEKEARRILESIRWPQGPICPHCGGIKNTRIQAVSDKTRDGVIQCNDCREQFTVTVRTVMHGSHITLRQWVQAFYSMVSHKKGVSALQLQRNLGLKSYRSAWHLAHRIRYAMKKLCVTVPLKGDVEVDETYVGGKPRFKGLNKRGRGTKKTPVMGLVQRDGRVKALTVTDVTKDTLFSTIKNNVHKSSRIITDDFPMYRGLGKEFAGGHEVIGHNKKEYVRGDVYTNTAESFFALLKRGVHGTYHHVSKEHLHRYCDEFSFRWNLRKVNDGERATAAIRGMEGKRLAYKAVTNALPSV